MVEKHIDRLTPDEQAMLAVASVAGAEFSAAVATAGSIGVREGEQRCEALARRGWFLRTTGVAEWPDGTVAGRYAFIHSLYRNVLYARIPFGHRVRLHWGAGERLEQGYGQRAGEIAGELAMHFAEGRDFARAARYHHQAGEMALRQHGYREAADHLTLALESLKALPDSQERMQQELTLHVMLGSALTALKGHAGPEVERAYARARELCDHVDDTPRLFPVLLGLGWFYLIRGSQDAARDVGRRLLAMAEATRDPAIFLAAHNALGLVSFYGGEFETALAHLERGIALYDPKAHSPTRSSAFRFILDPGMSCMVHAAWTLWVLGYPARAVARMQEALELALVIDHPFSLAHAHRFAAGFHLSMRERDAIHEQVERSLAVSTEHGFGPIIVAANFHRGWLLAEQGREEDGLPPMQAWVATCREIRSEALLPAYLAWLAETCGDIGRPREGLDLVDEGVATGTRSGNHYWTAELHRLRGVLTGIDTDSESSFVEALTIARRQRARSFELRAAMSLSRLWARQGKTREAHALLAEAYGWFTEGLDTADLKDAKTLLEELGTWRSGSSA
jgi:predicted ATPase